MGHSSTDVASHLVYLLSELAESTLVDLHAQPAAILDAFGKARADGLEGLMLKAACRPYGPLIASDGI